MSTKFHGAGFDGSKAETTEHTERHEARRHRHRHDDIIVRVTNRNEQKRIASREMH